MEGSDGGSRVRGALGSTDELLKSGVVLDGGEGGAANPRFVVTTSMT